LVKGKKTTTTKFYLITFLMHDKKMQGNLKHADLFMDNSKKAP